MGKKTKEINKGTNRSTKNGYMYIFKNDILAASVCISLHTDAAKISYVPKTIF